ncbi:hypothetical protein [Candidimonas nitroreducens]|uniref:Uncharacterized protein n=1 Tax=Candidimonas nitroreducens TaxID=683354 RepID=A0A225MD73_9BURK|nr:hypothetical protein [Candidimonas nitroreducens]OWT56919.1 hypothetical protein CEY11_18780 [Candidimonas nitroreducens]
MSDELKRFKAKVSSSPALKAQLLADVLNSLQKHGVDIHDKAVSAALGLDKPIDLGKINPAASSSIITITQ